MGHQPRGNLGDVLAPDKDFFVPKRFHVEPKEVFVGVVPQPPPREVGERHTAWECSYCHTYTSTEKEKCNNCGAPREAPGVPPRFTEPSIVNEPADKVEPDPALFNEVVK